MVWRITNNLLTCSFTTQKHNQQVLVLLCCVAAGVNSQLPSALFLVISNRQQLFCSVGKTCGVNQSRKYNTDLPLVNSELEHGEDAITASGNGDSEVEKQTAKSAVGIYQVITQF